MVGQYNTCSLPTYALLPTPCALIPPTCGYVCLSCSPTLPVTSQEAMINGING